MFQYGLRWAYLSSVKEIIMPVFILTLKAVPVPRAGKLCVLRLIKRLNNGIIDPTSQETWDVSYWIKLLLPPKLSLAGPLYENLDRTTYAIEAVGQLIGNYWVFFPRMLLEVFPAELTFAMVIMVMLKKLESEQPFQPLTVITTTLQTGNPNWWSFIIVESSS